MSLSSSISSFINILTDYFIEFAIIIGALAFVYWVFSSGRIKLLSQMIIDSRNKKIDKGQTIQDIVRIHNEKVYSGKLKEEEYIPEVIEYKFKLFRDINKDERRFV